MSDFLRRTTTWLVYGTLIMVTAMVVAGLATS